jgi:DNA (cytosine-5)-methyltransferase 1
MNELALFAGAGGGILGGHLLGWRTVCAVEWEPYPTSVLIARQNEGVLPPFPIWDDVRTFDGRPWRGRVDVVSGGFPCQDISAAGKGAGINGERSGMWFQMARIIREVGPRYAFVENSPMLTSRGLGRVLGDLASMGYDARWGVLGAVDAGAPHKRDRIWIVAHSDLHEHRTNGRKEGEQGVIPSEHRPERCSRGIGGTGGDSEILADANAQRCSWGGLSASERKPLLHAAGSRGSDETSTARNGREADKDLAHANCAQCEGVRRASRSDFEHADAHASSAWWRQDPAEVSKSDVGRMAHGVAARVDRLKAIGNGQVPSVAALAWRILSK